MESYYTYIYYDTLREEPIYIGKGKDNRAWQHLKSTKACEFIHRIKKMIKANNPPKISIYAGLDNELACLVEMELIHQYGRKDLGKGPLLNLTNGGEGTPGRILSIATREKISITKTGSKIENTENYTAAALLRTYTPERNKKVSESLKGHIVTNETKAKISAKSLINSAGEGNGMFGKTQSTAAREKMRLSATGRTQSQASITKMVETKRLKKIEMARA